MPKELDKTYCCYFNEFIICAGGNCRKCGWNPKEQRQRNQLPLIDKDGMKRKQLCRNKKGY